VSVLIVTGTGTGVGKTVVTAALAAHAKARGLDVAVCKPVQTGTHSDSGAGDDDLAEIGRLSGLRELVGLARYPQPLAPLAAAVAAGMELPTGAAIVDLIRATDRPGQLTLVEGAGGLLVQLAADSVTLRDLAVELGAPVVVVVPVVLGALNYTALTLEALEARAVSCAGLIIGSWPAQPGAVEVSNREALQKLAPVRAALPAGAGSLSHADFEVLSARAFGADWVAALVN
jgi:dethiobiotin synthetase